MSLTDEQRAQLREIKETSTLLWTRQLTIWLLDLVDSLEKENSTQKEELSKFMIAWGFSTGHGDSVNELLNELGWQLRAREVSL